MIIFAHYFKKQIYSFGIQNLILIVMSADKVCKNDLNILKIT